MKTRRTLKRIIAFVLSLVSVLSLAGGASADTAGASIQNGWLSYRNGGCLYIPEGFTLWETIDAEGYGYNFYNGRQQMYLGTTEQRFPNDYNASEVLATEYYRLTESLPKAVYDDRSENSFTLSGYEGSHIYYVQHLFEHHTLYTISFRYPIVNRAVCDPIVETVCNSFSASGEAKEFGMKNTPGPWDLDAIGANIKYPNYDWMYLSDYQYAVVSHDRAVYCFKDPDSDIWRKGNYFTVNRGTAITILAESQGYACVILTGTRKAGWINMDYLSFMGTEQASRSRRNEPQYNPDSFSGGYDYHLGDAGIASVPAYPQSAFGKAYKENLQDGVYYSDREKANLVTETYYDRKDSNGNRKSWYTSSYYSDPVTGYMINFYYADGVLFFADAYIPGERSSVTFYFWGNQMFACHDLRYSGSRLSFNGEADFDSVVREFGNLSLHAS